jgi:(S)-ureidoglycine aminohydrolase
MKPTLLAILRPIPLSAILLIGATAARAQPTALAQSDTLTAQVASYPGSANQVLRGSTHDLSLLDIRTLSVKSAILLSGKADTADELLIVKEGDLDLTIQGGNTTFSPAITTGLGPDSTTTLGPGSVVLIPAGISYSLEAKRSTYYRLRFESRHEANPIGIKGPTILTWSNMPVQHTAKGETRQIFSQPTSWLAKIDLHATTLNPGEVSHPPHIHRAEEIILMRTGHVREYINGKHCPATGGDLIFLPSGNPHALENTGTERAEYFALQWQP